MISLDLALIFFFLLVAFNYRVQRSVLYPPFIFCAMWLLDLVVYRSGFIEIDPVHGNTLVIVAAGAASFSLGGLLAGLAPRKLLRFHLFPPKPGRMSYFLRNILTIVLLCGLPVLFYQTKQLSNLVGGGFNMLAQARTVIVVEAQSGEWTGSFVLNYFTQIAVCFSLLFATGKKDRQFWGVTVIAFIACILSTGRGGFLVLISGLIAIRLLQRKQETLRSAIPLIRWPIVLFAALFIGLIFSNKNTEGMTGSTTSIATFFVLSAIAGPLAAFDRVVQSPADFMTPWSHTFQFPLHLAATLHLISGYDKIPMLDSFVFVPFQMNVYTVFKFYYLELGIIGALVLLFFVGLLHSLLYLKAKQGGRFSTYLFAFSIYSVLVVIFDDAYSDIATYLRAFTIGLLYFLMGSITLRLLPTIKARSPLKNPRLEESDI
jgi:oligosaccharide repeat unit polymerase